MLAECANEMLNLDWCVCSSNFFTVFPNSHHKIWKRKYTLHTWHRVEFFFYKTKIKLHHLIRVYIILHIFEESWDILRRETLLCEFEGPYSKGMEFLCISRHLYSWLENNSKHRGYLYTNFVLSWSCNSLTYFFQLYQPRWFKNVLYICMLNRHWKKNVKRKIY